MANSDLVRFSRDGDQFHYLWAARRCLCLLAPISGLIAVTIEGASTNETAPELAIEAGEQLIDVAEYYGSESIEQASLIRYIQLKHSTQHADEPWQPSGLEKTLAGFAKRYRELEQRFGVDALVGKLEFWFVSNRPIGTDILEAVEDAAAESISRHPEELKKLEHFTALAGVALSAFCKLLHFEGGQQGYWEQRNILALDMGQYLPDADVDAPVQLKELVNRKALSENTTNPTITKIDVLRVLKTDEAGLFPAPCRINPAGDIVPREQEASLVAQIMGAVGPVLIHASAGVGKSVFATCIERGLPEGSRCVVYDCFGNGLYRSASGYRHRHKDALVQIANELAAQGLCYPLIPTPNADPSAYAKAFLYRLRQSVASLRETNADAILCIAVDAADNAQMAANEIGEPRSFAKDLLREQMPEGVRLIELCRTERRHLLDPPSNTASLELRPFSRAETAAYLRQFFPNAIEHDVDEFHHLSSQNPRVQATALSRPGPLPEILRALGPNPTSVEDTISQLLSQAVADLRDRAGPTEQANVDLICAGLAALRPLIPISVLAAISNVDEAAVRSFAVDLGRPLIVLGDTVQFFDEPAETWFREQFKPKASQLAGFIELLKPLASTSAYVASALPQLMLEAGQFAELVALALSSEGLPSGSPLEKRDVELQRLQFALKASLRAKRYTDAAKLALKAGGEAAGDDRQQKLLQQNTDLASVLMDVDRIQEIVSRRTFGGGWIGAHHVYEAAFMSGHAALQGDARSRLRMAHEWLANLVQLPAEQRRREDLTHDDIAELAMAHLNIHGAENSARMLGSWTPREISFQAGRILARRLVDHGRYQDLDALALAAKDNLCLVLAIVLELQEVHRSPPKAVLDRALPLMRRHRAKIQKRNRWDHRETVLEAVTALVVACHRHTVGTAPELAALLADYLPKAPPPGLGARFGAPRFPLVRAYALHAALAGQVLQLNDLAEPKLREELEDGKRHHHSREADEFKENVGAVLPWHQLWARTVLGLPPEQELVPLITEVRTASSKAANISYREESWTSDEIAQVWLDILVGSGKLPGEAIGQFNLWIDALKRPLFTSTLTSLARLCAQAPGFQSESFKYASRAFALSKDAREHAESLSDTYVGIARAVITISKDEAAAYFNRAVEVASKIGDENLDRWASMLDLADRAAAPERPAAEAAYKLARCAEVTYEYVARDKHFDWEATVKAITALCPSSGLAILSRWRDRDFGWAERLLPAAIEFLLEQSRIDPKTTIALLAFRAQWEFVQLVREALKVCTSGSERESTFAFAYRYIRLEEHGPSTWRKLKDVVAAQGLAISDIDELIASSELTERSSHSNTDDTQEWRSRVEDERKQRDWGAIFEGADLSSRQGVSEAHGRFREGPAPYYHDHFFQEACARVAVGKETDFIRAFALVPEFDLYHLRAFLQKLPDNWKNRLSIQRTVADVLRSFCQKYCMDITRSRYYQVLPFKTVCELSGIPETEIADVVLSAIGEATHVVGAGRLFTLVGLLALKLSHDEALDALSFGLGLFDAVLEDRDGDGPWSAALAPASDLNGAIAGYVWAGLASPKASVRWEAAHVVRGLCTLGRTAALESLVALAKAGCGGTFADARLHFYGLHARQWLVIALARAALETPGAVSPHADFLMELALNGEPHVLIRHFAARAILMLCDSGHVSIDATVEQRLRDVNKPALPVEVSRTYERYNGERQQPKQREEKRFLFGLDIGPYWFAPLGRCFAKSEGEITIEAEEVLQKWGHSDYERWDDDERWRRKIFKDRETSHSHGSYPHTDELRFYLAYHAMMVVAGKLLASASVHRDPDDGEDAFQNWLREAGLTRDDGRWLTDRRDPAPLPIPAWCHDKADDNWRWSVCRDDFAQYLGMGSDRLNFWGRWTTIWGQREETVHVASALVSPDRSASLLRALQTATNPHDFRIPDADDDLQIESGAFQLKGWVVDRTRDRGLDRFDPWSGDISCPPIKPACAVINLMGLVSDSEHRSWYIRSREQQGAALWSQTWGYYNGGDDENEGGRGRTLQASFSFITAFLMEVGMDLIVEVEIERRTRRLRYESYKDDGLGYVLASVRLFLIKSDGTIHGL